MLQVDKLYVQFSNPIIKEHENYLKVWFQLI